MAKIAFERVSMELISCISCGQMISARAVLCLHCGHRGPETPKSSDMLQLLTFARVALFILFILSLVLPWFRIGFLGFETTTSYTAWAFDTLRDIVRNTPPPMSTNSPLAQCFGMLFVSPLFVGLWWAPITIADLYRYYIKGLPYGSPELAGWPFMMVTIVAFLGLWYAQLCKIPLLTMGSYVTMAVLLLNLFVCAAMTSVLKKRRTRPSTAV